jgi:hypothetical protein
MTISEAIDIVTTHASRGMDEQKFKALTMAAEALRRVERVRLVKGKHPGDLLPGEHYRQSLKASYS